MAELLPPAPLVGAPTPTPCVGGLLRNEANPKLRPFLQAMADIRRYDTVPDDFAFNRNSGGFLAGVGTLYTLTPRLSGEVFLGIMRRNYTDPSFKTLTEPAADATLRWQATDSAAVVLFTERTIEETTLYASPGFINAPAGGRIEQRSTNRLTGILRAACAHSDFARWDAMTTTWIPPGACVTG